MITSAKWTYIFQNWPGEDGVFRPAKKTIKNDPPTQGGIDEKDSPNLINDGQTWLRKGDNSCTIDKITYNFVFWSLVATDPEDPTTVTNFTPYTSVDINWSPDNKNDWVVEGKAYFVREWGTGSGAHAVFMDAFDLDSNDWIADDFVDVRPDKNGMLFKQANNGYINTSLLQSEITIKARNKIVRSASMFQDTSRLEFQLWQEILTKSKYDNEKKNKETGNTFLIVNKDDLILAFAFYKEYKIAAHKPKLPYEAANDPWWVIRTHGGLVPPDHNPSDPWLRERLATISLIFNVDLFSKELHDKLLRLASQQLLITASKSKPNNELNRNLRDVETGLKGEENSSE